MTPLPGDRVEEERVQDRPQTMTLNEEADPANPTCSINTDEDPAVNYPSDHDGKTLDTVANLMLGAKGDPDKNKATVDEGEALGTHRPSSTMRDSVFQRGSLQRAKLGWSLDPPKTLGAQLEDRFVELERKVRALLGDRSLAQDDDDASGDVPLISDIKELGWADFKPQLGTHGAKMTDYWPHRKEMEDEPKHVIEILKEQPRQTQFFTITGIPFSAVGNSAVVQNINHNTDAYQIRIRSEILIRTLNELTGCRTKIGPYGHRLLLLRPFKLLVSFEKDIRNRLEELEKLHATGDRSDPQEEAPSTGSQEPSHAAGPLKEIQSVKALEHLRVLCRAINTYLTHSIKLQHSLSHDSGPTIAFHDLWCLFKPGYEVVGQEMSRMQL